MDDVFAGLILLAFVLSPIWVLIDAPKHGMSRAWAAGAFVFWIVVFPLYLVVRASAKRRSEQPAQEHLQPAVQQMPAGAPPAWLPDPWIPGRYRYWDGTRWTNNSSDSPK